MKLDIKLPMVYHTSLNKDDNFPHYILASGEHCGVRFYICNINGMHPTAYLRIPKGKPLYGAEYDYANEFIDVHGGLTYASDGLLGVENDDDSWFLGWDYGHCDDFAGYYLRNPNDYLATHNHKWTTDEIIEECKKACEELANLWRIDDVKELGF